MTDKPSDEKEAERRFNETLTRLANTPHKPHVKKSVTEAPKASKKEGGHKDRP